MTSIRNWTGNCFRPAVMFEYEPALSAIKRNEPARHLEQNRWKNRIVSVFYSQNNSLVVNKSVTRSCSASIKSCADMVST